MTEKIHSKDAMRRLINVAWMRNGELSITGEALILACLLHSTGSGRDSKDMSDLQRIMKDQNLDRKA